MGDAKSPEEGSSLDASEISKPPAKASRQMTTLPPSASANPLWAPPRYIPANNAAERGPRTLSLVEDVVVRDGGFVWQRAKAFLDTGNQHMTLVDSAFAERHA